VARNHVLRLLLTITELRNDRLHVSIEVLNAIASTSGRVRGELATNVKLAELTHATLVKTYFMYTKYGGELPFHTFVPDAHAWVVLVRSAKATLARRAD
jgi:hypothetical protein